jgi:hypothetical protein
VNVRRSKFRIGPVQKIVAAFLIVSVFSTVVRGQADASSALDQSIGKGLAYLSRQQNPDGSFDSGGPRIAMTGLTLMSFLAAGHTPGAGKYGGLVRNATDFLLKSAPDDGYFGRVDGSRMYGHGIATLALAEVYGVETSAEKREQIRAVLLKSVKVILAAQDVKKEEPHGGGWRYEPQSLDSDLSLSGWNVLALRACRSAGLAVSKEPIDRAVAYVLKCYKPDQHAFAYQPGRDASVAMTGVAVLSLYLMDNPARKELTESLPYLRDQAVTDDTHYPCYARYYSVQAAYQSGGPLWQAVWKRTSDTLLASQVDDGGWPPSRSPEEPGRAYSTAVSVLTLAIPYRLLPIYQR